MNALWGRVAALLLASLSAAACNEDGGHPARLTCPPERAPCGPIDQPPAGGFVPSADGGVPPDVAVPDGGTTLSGNVFVLPDSFDTAQATLLAESARVQVEAEGGGMLVQASVTNGGYAVSGVRVDVPVWAAVVPDGSTDLITTLQPLNTTGLLVDGGPSLASLAVVRPSSLDLVLGVLSLPTARLPGFAHVVFQFLDESGAPVEGVTVRALEGETVAYDAGESWADDAAGTGPRGLAVVANVTALAYPGSDHPRTLGGVASGDVMVRFAADSVTYEPVLLATGP